MTAAPAREWPHGGRTTFLGILNHHDAAGTDFAAIKGEGRVPTRTRPLLVVVHPGDLIEPTPDRDPESRTAFHYGIDNQRGTAGDLATAIRLGWDVAVLHRGSCTQFKPSHGWVNRGLGRELRRVWERGWVGYGDDLEAASRWLVEAAAPEGRPLVVLAGAYSSPGHGCVTIVAERLLAAAPGIALAVSRHSPGGNTVGSHVWRPGRGVMSHIEARELDDPMSGA